jgi:hypothetical protein
VWRQAVLPEQCGLARRTFGQAGESEPAVDHIVNAGLVLSIKRSDMTFEHELAAVRAKAHE